MIETNSVELAARLNSLVEEVKETKSNLCKELSIVDLKISDIQHYIENKRLNGVEGYKAYKLLQDTLKERRAIKKQFIVFYLLKFFSISFSISRILVFHLSLCQCFCQFWDHFIHMLFFNDKRRYQTQYIALCLDHKKSFLNGTVIYLRDRLL